MKLVRDSDSSIWSKDLSSLDLSKYIGREVKCPKCGAILKIEKLDELQISNPNHIPKFFTKLANLNNTIRKIVFPVRSAVVSVPCNTGCFGGCVDYIPILKIKKDLSIVPLKNLLD